MSKADKAGEPSMDEILASIRKIIAEEPVGARKAASSEGAAADGGNSRAPMEGKSSLDDARQKPDAAPRADAAADANTRLRDEGPSWLRPAAMAPPMGQADKATGQREPVKPFFSEPGRAPGSMADPLSPPTVGPPQSVDFGAIVPRRAADGSIEVPGGASAERRPQSGRLPEWLARSAPATPQSGRMTGPLPPPAEPTRVPPRDGAVPGAALSELATLRTNGVAPIPPPPGIGMDNAPRVAQPVSAQPMVVETPRPAPLAAATEAAVKDGGAAAAAPDAKLEPREIGAPLAKSLATSALDAMPARASGALPAQSPEPAGGFGSAPINAVGVAEPVNGIAQAPKASGGRMQLNGASEPHGAVAVSTHSAMPMEPAGPRDDRPVPVTEPTSALPKPAALGERAKSPKPTPAADLVPAVPTATGVRSLEDTVVDLLRPMIRQWLDENMPRMVEKALRIELAQSVKPKIEPPKH